MTESDESYPTEQEQHTSIPSSSSSSSCCQRLYSPIAQWKAMGHNVRLNILYSIFSSFGSSIVIGSVFLSPYIYFLEGTNNGNQEVGYVSGIAGLTMVIFALPIGWLTDRFPRDVILRISAWAGIISSIVLFLALIYNNMYILYAASALNGLYSAIAGPPLASIFADSIPSGQRTYLYALQYSLSLAAGAAGPLIGVFFFLYLGNEWKTYQLRIVMIAGNIINTLACFLLFGFRDSDSLGNESEGVLADKNNLLQSPIQKKSSSSKENITIDEEHSNTIPNITESINNEAPLLVSDEETISKSSSSSSSSTVKNLGHQKINLGFMKLRVSHIPYIIFASDFTIAVGAGMTVQYFALFFVNEYNLSPLTTATLWVISPLVIAFLSGLAVPLSKYLGRAVVAVLCDAIGTACLFALSYHSPVWFAVPLYVLRTAAMNASYPVQRAILMDVVPKNTRGKWNSLEGLTSFTWTGSAVLGGYLIDQHGYGFTFFITGAIYITATCILCLLIPLTWGEKIQENNQDNTIPINNTNNTTNLKNKENSNDNQI